MTVPPKYLHYVGNWSFTHKDNLEAIQKELSNSENEGWMLITIASGLAYWRKENPEFWKYIETQVRK